MSLAVHLVVGAESKPPTVHTLHLVNMSFERCLRNVRALTESVVASLPEAEAACAAATLAQTQGCLDKKPKRGFAGRGARAQTTWRPKIDLGVGLRSDAAAAADTASGTLVVMADGKELSTKTRGWAFQHTHEQAAGPLVGVLMVVERPWEMQAAHALSHGSRLLRPSARLPAAQITRALAHKFKRTLQKAEHTAMVRSVVPVHSHLDAQITTTAFGVVWKTTMEGVDFYSVFC